MPPLVSVIVPTWRRHDYLPLIEACFRRQTWPNLELLILDDTETPTAHFAAAPPNIRYIHEARRQPIGTKRNRLVAEARGEIIVQFDDDDFYAPDYVATMVAALGDDDVVKLSGWYAYGVAQQVFCYWDTAARAPLQFLVESQQPFTPVHGQPVQDGNVRGFGFSYVYRKTAWQAAPFPDRDFGEDYAWIQALGDRCRIRAIPDAQGLVLHIIHRANTSRIFPQFLLPPVLLTHLFGPDVQPYIAR